MKRPLSFALGAVLAAGVLASAPTAAADDDPVLPPSSASTCQDVSDQAGVGEDWATATGTISSPGGNVVGASVYAINTENGKMTCAVTNGAGSYTLDLVGSGVSLRGAADFWLIVANPPLDSTLASNSKVLRSSLVAENSSQTVNTALLPATTAISITMGADDTTGFACSYTDESGPLPALCAMSQPYATGGFVAKMSLPTGKDFIVDGFAYREATHYQGYIENEVPGGAPGPFALPLEPTSLPECSGHAAFMGGTVTKGAGIPAQAWMTGFALFPDGPQRILETWSLPSGQFRACTNNVPGSFNDDSLIVTYTSLLGGNAYIKQLNGLSDDSKLALDLSLSAPVQVGGTVLRSGQPSVNTVWNVAILDSNGVPGPPIFQQSRTSETGAWGVFGLPDDNYVFLAYPNDDDSAVAMKAIPFTISSGMVSSWAGGAVTPSFQFAAPDVVLSAGNVTGVALKPDGKPQALSRAVLRACTDPQDSDTCIMRMGRTNSQGRFAFELPPAVYAIAVTVWPNWYDSDVLETTSAPQTTAANGSAYVPVTMARPNAGFQIVKGAGSPVPIPDSWGSLGKYAPLEAENPDDPWTYSSNGSTANDSGTMYFNIEDSGIYRLEVSPPSSDWGPLVVTYLQVTVNPNSSLTMQTCERPVGDATPCSGAKTPFNPTDGVWRLTRPIANVTGTLLSSAAGGVPVEEGNITLELVTDSNRQWFGWSNTSNNGEVALYLPPGTYEVRFQKPQRGPQSSQSWAPNSYYMTANDAGVCLRVNASTPCTPSAPLNRTFNLVTPNLTGTAQTMSGSPLTDGWVQVFASDGSGGERYITGVNVTAGSFALNLPSDDTYSIVIDPRNAADGTRTRFTQYIASGQTYTRTFKLQGANVTGKVTLAGGASAPGAEIQVERFIQEGDFERWSWVNVWARTNGSGDFSMKLDAGSYRLRVQPAPGTPNAATAYSATFTLASNDDTKVVNVALASPNVSGTVTLPGGAPASYSWIEIQRWSTDREQYEWSESTPGSMANQAGQFSLSVPSGRWQITANPPWGNTTASRTSVNVLVSESSVCLDNGNGSCSGGALSSVNIGLSAPNVSGTVKFVGGAPAGNTWIDVRKFDASLDRYEWDASLQGINVNSNGAFAATLPNGDYRLLANPPWGNSTATRATEDITVSGAFVCRTVDKPCGAGNAIAPGALDITLGSPNVQGSVTADGDAVAGSNLQVEKWDDASGQWRWQDLWANTSQSGSYSLSLTDNASYRLTAQPTGLTGDFSAGRAYVHVNGNQLCAPSNEAAATSESPCTLAAAPLTLNIALTSADLVGKITNGTDPLRDAWVSLLKQNTAGWYEWVGGTPSKTGGKFALSLETGGTNAKYRIEVFPPWGSNSDLTRKSVDIVAYTSGGNTKVCLAANWSDASSTCAAVVGELTIALTGGNVRGFVKVPSPDDTGVRDAGISVEKWVEAPWNPGSGQFTWMWADLFTNTRSGGAYSLSIDEPGTYRLEARPPWSNPSGLSSGKSIITVNASGEWCTQDDTTGSSAAAFGTCEGPLSTDSSRLTLRLSSPNVTTRVYNQSGGVPVADAWVAVTRDVVQSVPGSDDTYVSRLWVGGTPTNSSGYAYMNLTQSGSYTLEVNPPWQSATALPRFSKTFTLTCTGGNCTESGLDDSIWFPQPNVNGFILNADDSSVKVSNSWISVEKSVGAGDYRWTDQGTSSNGKGKYVLSLEDGAYRVTAWPAWDNPSGVSRSVNISVSGGVATCSGGCAAGSSFDIQLRKANVSGSLVYGSPSQAMPFAWVEVRQGGSTVAGTSTNAQGAFSLNLDNGTYTFTAYPNWGVAAKPPVSTTVVVSGGVVTSVGGVAAGTVLMDFDAVEPSLILYVGGNVTGNRFVTVSEWSGSGWSPLTSLTAVAASGVARFTIPAGTYRLTVVPGIGAASSNNSVDVTIDGDPASIQTASVNPTEVAN